MEESMAFRRNIFNSLDEWKNKDGHKPLVMRGARQVGKTTVIKEFGKTFDTFIALNLEKSGDRVFFYGRHGSKAGLSKNLP